MPKQIEMKPVNGSSSIQAAGYDPDTSTMSIQFNNGGIYEMDNVPAGVWNGFTAAGSKGSFYQRSIKGQYQTTKRQ